jgi:hypothetical protein
LPSEAAVVTDTEHQRATRNALIPSIVADTRCQNVGRMPEKPRARFVEDLGTVEKFSTFCALEYGKFRTIFNTTFWPGVCSIKK